MKCSTMVTLLFNIFTRQSLIPFKQCWRYQCNWHHFALNHSPFPGVLQNKTLFKAKNPHKILIKKELTQQGRANSHSIWLLVPHHQEICHLRFRAFFKQLITNANKKLTLRPIVQKTRCPPGQAPGENIIHHLHFFPERSIHYYYPGT